MMRRPIPGAPAGVLGAGGTEVAAGGGGSHTAHARSRP